MAQNIPIGQILTRSIKSGCLLSFGLTCVTSVIAGVLVSLLVPGAWRGRPLFSEPASISIFLAAVLGFIVGFATALYRMIKSGKRT
jgi:hypothetical protein